MRLTRILNQKRPETADSKAVKEAFRGLDETCKKIIAIRPKYGKDGQVVDEALRNLINRLIQ